MITLRNEAILRSLVKNLLEREQAQGIATGGTTTTLIDTKEWWPKNKWVNATCSILKNGRTFRLTVASNTETELTFAETLPVPVAAGDEWAITRPALDLSDRPDRQLGIVRSLTQWAGSPLTPRDISLDLANLDTLLSSRASESTLAARASEATLGFIRDILTNVFVLSRNLDLTVANSITLDTVGRQALEVWAESSAATTFRLDVSGDGVDWIENYETWVAVTSVKAGYLNAWRHIRLRSDPAGVAGDLVSLALTAGR